ncbi:hypothetical protein [Virgisporangium aurantiacum]|uniref:Uncharacterized protein n=1 Tax=Virgisporangium aurantiacum TaxID=175570 RepID=A0A8J3ZLL3_9ACTN|nr:hypothetical protein [Virgisporangium aurantiacum]GIJ63758.1 hypothetical protein Vau01_112740 [Virgisporangium aurantiacum]
MEFQIAISAPADSHPFEVAIEPEGMSYALPATTKVVLTFRGSDAMTVELTHHPDALIIWRPADTEVWATTADGRHEQIAGWKEIPAPGLDSGGAPLTHPMRTMIETLFHGRETP